MLAHELRNPLAPIVSSVELLKIEESAEGRAGLVDTIEAHARTISLLLDDLLDISRISHNKLELRQEKVAVQEVLKRSLEMVQPFVTARRHELRLEIPEGALELYADPVRLEQIFVNLLNNAAKYTDPGGVITLACKTQRGQLVVSIADTGIGIAPEKLGGVFEPFGQTGAVVRRPGGLGVGLSLTKRLVEQHRGTVEAKSAGLGRGSEFIVRLPLLSAQASGLAPNKKQGLIAALTLKKAPAPKGGLRVLVVDDNAPAAKGLGKLLGHAGHEVALAYDGAGALAAAQTFKPAAILLDIGLPDIDGYELGKKIKETIGAPVRLIALTGYGQEEHRVKTRLAGFDAHLVKPVSIADVERALMLY